MQQEFDRTVPSLEQRIDQLVKTSRQIVRRQRYLGDLPIKRSRVVHPAFQAYDRRRGMYTVPAETEDQVYDRVEELDQTHADRRLELATDLVRLPAFTAYCRTEDGQYRLRLPPPTAVDPDWQRSCMERIRQTSKHQIGLPPESSAPRTPRPADGLPPSVSRYHPDEPKP